MKLNLHQPKFFHFSIELLMPHLGARFKFCNCITIKGIKCAGFICLTIVYISPSDFLPISLSLSLRPCSKKSPLTLLAPYFIGPFIHMSLSWKRCVPSSWVRPHPFNLWSYHLLSLENSGWQSLQVIQFTPSTYITHISYLISSSLGKTIFLCFRALSFRMKGRLCLHVVVGVLSSRGSCSASVKYCFRNPK